MLDRMALRDWQFVEEDILAIRKRSARNYIIFDNMEWTK